MRLGALSSDCNPLGSYFPLGKSLGRLLDLSKLIEAQAEFQALAETRLEEAKMLLDHGKWDGAYYLAGYSVELALKSCVVKYLMATDAFPKKEFSRDCYTHRIEKLVLLAQLKPALDDAATADPILLSNWNVACDWSEEKRYHRMEQAEAEAIYNAVSDAVHGVLQWIKLQW